MRIIYYILLIVFSFLVGPLLYLLIRPNAFVNIIEMGVTLALQQGATQFVYIYILDLFGILVMIFVIGFLIDKVFNKFKVNTLLRVILMILVVILCWKIFPTVLDQKLATIYPQKKDSYDSHKSAAIELMGEELEKYNTYYGYYPKDLTSTFSYDLNQNSIEFLKAQKMFKDAADIHTPTLCDKDPTTKKPFEYLPKDCDGEKCRDYRIIAILDNFDGEQNSRLERSRKECKHESTNQYVVCSATPYKTL